MSDADDRRLRWRKSSKSAQDTCVEMARLERIVFVRDSKDPDGPMVELTRSGWSAFIAALHGGGFDRAATDDAP